MIASSIGKGLCTAMLYNNMKNPFLTKPLSSLLVKRGFPIDKFRANLCYFFFFFAVFFAFLAFFFAAMVLSSFFLVK
jgi:hypothetical protein